MVNHNVGKDRDTRQCIRHGFWALRVEIEKLAFVAEQSNAERHEREFFYFNAESPETVPDTLPRIAVFSYIKIEKLAFVADQSNAERREVGGIFVKPLAQAGKLRLIVRAE